MMFIRDEKKMFGMRMSPVSAQSLAASMGGAATDGQAVIKESSLRQTDYT